jgi:hypothetical protein
MRIDKTFCDICKGEILPKQRYWLCQNRIKKSNKGGWRAITVCKECFDKLLVNVIHPPIETILKNSNELFGDVVEFSNDS